ncbi:MAG: Re/Si-specific NAD(P)(+) transhydrogenase subunit alpha [Gammaproteobacteria bacterium]|nr:MAG: Re/Si-specific NAD(P)(+) transhydrogenase subunit alpha [Gammaproteobacteria bacterium]
MPVALAVPKEVVAGERRVALVPDVARKFADLGVDVLVEKDAGKGCLIPDSAYESARIVGAAGELFGQADVLVCVQPLSVEQIRQLKKGSIVLGLLAPYSDPERVKALRDGGVTSFALELVPRITRAQAVDVLSSQASVAGYKAVLLAANVFGKFFPMLTTAAGTIRPASVLVIGVGVAGLQAIATARRLGGMVSAYDVRPETREQVESLGGKFIELGVSAVGEGGYARELTDEEKQQQQDELAAHIAKADVVITTAAVPGRPAPRIITKAMVEGMKPGSLILDLAAESGGNCELTKAGEQIEHNNVIIYGPVNVPSMLPVHASEMYAKNLLNFLSPFIEDGELKFDWDDEIIAGSCLTRDGEIRHEATRESVEGA